MPGDLEAFLRSSKPAGTLTPPAATRCAHTTVVVHLDLDKRAAALHLGPLLSDDERRYPDLRCHLRGLVPAQRQLIGAGRTTRVISRLRRALEHRHPMRGSRLRGHPRPARPPHPALEDGGPPNCPTSCWVCPYHHRAHHRGLITITGPAERLTVTDDEGQPPQHGPDRPPPSRPPPAVPPVLAPPANAPLVVVRTLPTATTTERQLGPDALNCRAPTLSPPEPLVPLRRSAAPYRSRCRRRRRR